MSVAGKLAGLRVGGLTPWTAIDYPGELAAVIYCQGCPFRCRYCHNGHLLDARQPAALSWVQVLDFLSARRGLLDAAVFSGGEPTLQSALAQAMESVRGLGMKVGLHTAGPYPRRLARVLHLVDWVGLDIKALPQDYPAVTGVPGSGAASWESLALLIESGVSLQVRTTPMPGFDSPKYLTALGERLTIAGVRWHVVQAFRTRRILDPGVLAQGTPGLSRAA